MPMNNDTEKTQYKKLLLFFIIDQFLLPTSEKAYVRSSMYKHADDLNNFEQINWAQSALDLIHSAAKNVAKGKSNFVACTPVLEAMLFERIKKLQPAQSSKYVSNIPPVFKYKSSRNSFAKWRKKVESLTPSDIVECPHCVRQEVMDAAGEDGHTVLPENTVVEVVGEGENNDLEVAVSPLSDDVGEDEHTVLPENPVAEVVGEGENNDLRVSVSPLSDDVGEGRTDSFDLFANADVEASIQSPLSDSPHRVSPEEQIQESDVVVAAESVFVEQRVVQPPLRCFERKRRRGQKVVGQEGVSAAEPASQGVGAAEAAIVHEAVPAEINRIGSGDLCSSIMVVTASKRKKLRVSYDSKSDDDDVHLRAKSLSTLNLGASSSSSSWVESNEKLYEGRTKVSKSKQEEFESQVKELESKKKQFESQEKVLRLKAKLFERQADDLESFKKLFESQLKRLKSKEKIFERRIKESESKEQHFQRRVKEFESKEEELELRDSQHES